MVFKPFLLMSYLQCFSLLILLIALMGDIQAQPVSDQANTRIQSWYPPPNLSQSAELALTRN